MESELRDFEPNYLGPRALVSGMLLTVLLEEGLPWTSKCHVHLLTAEALKS